MKSSVAPAGRSRTRHQLMILREQNADHDRELVDGHQLAAHLGRRDLGDIHRRQARGQPDGHTAEHSPRDKDGKIIGQRIAQGSDRKQQRGQNQQPLAAKLVAQPAGNAMRPPSSRPARNYWPSRFAPRWSVRNSV